MRLGLIALLGLTACDFPFGVTRTARLPADCDRSAVYAALVEELGYQQDVPQLACFRWQGPAWVTVAFVPERDEVVLESIVIGSPVPPDHVYWRCNLMQQELVEELARRFPAMASMAWTIEWIRVDPRRAELAGVAFADDRANPR